MIDSERHGWASLILLIPNTILLLFGIAIFVQKWGTYGDVIYQETQNWSKGFITDVVTVNTSSCPANYTELVALYMGTEDICKTTGSEYDIGACSQGSSGTFQKGLPPQNLSYFDGVKVCYARSKSNYNSIASNRLAYDASKNNSAPPNLACNLRNITCGANDNIDLFFCYPGTKCPMNGLHFNYTQSTIDNSTSEL
jgi:hypothetical protein